MKKEVVVFKLVIAGLRTNLPLEQRCFIALWWLQLRKVLQKQSKFRVIVRRALQWFIVAMNLILQKVPPSEATAESGRTRIQLQSQQVIVQTVQCSTEATEQFGRIALRLFARQSGRKFLLFSKQVGLFGRINQSSEQVAVRNLVPGKVGFVRPKAKSSVALWLAKDFRKVRLLFEECQIVVPILRIKTIKVAILVVDRIDWSMIVEVVVGRITLFPEVTFITIIVRTAFIVRIKWSEQQFLT